MIESQPDLASKLRRVRGGYLKIQGTWMPYEIALRLARRYILFLRFKPSANETMSTELPGPSETSLSLYSGTSLFTFTVSGRP